MGLFKTIGLTFEYLSGEASEPDNPRGVAPSFKRQGYRDFMMARKRELCLAISLREAEFEKKRIEGKRRDEFRAMSYNDRFSLAARVMRGTDRKSPYQSLVEEWFAGLSERVRLVIADPEEYARRFPPEPERTYDAECCDRH